MSHRFSYRHLPACLLIALATTLSVPAQTPPGLVQFLAANVKDSGGNLPLSSGQLCVLTTDASDRPMGYRIGSGSGQTSASVDQASCASVTNGVVAQPFQVINSAASSPLNACLRVVTKDVNGNPIRTSKCVQTGVGSQFGNWCSNANGQVICNWDTYPVGTIPQPLVQVGPPGPAGVGPTGCVVGSGPNACTTALTPKSLGGVFYAAGFGAQCVNGDDTAALQAAITAAKAVNAGGTQGKLVLPPGKCGTSQTLDFTGLTVEGAGGKTNTSMIVPTTTNPAFDMIQTSGATRMVSISVYGGWNGAAGQSSNCVSNISKPSNGQFGYQLDLRDVHLGNCGNDGLLLTDAAYVNLDTVRFDAIGSNGIEQRSGATAGFQNTTLNFAGQVGFGSAGKAAVLINNAVNVAYSGSITTMEGDGGLVVTGGGNRALNLSNLYFENNPNASNGKCIDLTASSGIGLLLASNFGPGCAGVFPDDVKGWSKVQSVSNDFGFSPPSFDDGIATILRSYNVSVNGPQTYRLAISDQGTVAGSSWTSVGIVANGAGNSWNAKFVGVFLDGTTQPRNAMEIEISSANPSVVIGGVTMACTIGDGTAQGGPNNTISGVFQCRSYNYAAFAGNPRFLGEVTLTVAQQFGSNAGVALQTSDAVVAGAVVAANGINGQCPSGQSPVFTAGIATSCK